MGKLIYTFEEGSAHQVELLGSKGAHLSNMYNMGIPVPPGFVITTEVCREYTADNFNYVALSEALSTYIKNLEYKTGKIFGGVENPLIVSVRSGAPVSMPGMMDTILNVGLNRHNVDKFAEAVGYTAAYESYIRFLRSYGTTVLGQYENKFNKRLSTFLERDGVYSIKELSPASLVSLVKSYETYCGLNNDHNDDYSILFDCVKAVFRSWGSARAIAYREHANLSSVSGTACVVMAMVFGNLGPDSGTGVLFTRNPNTGVKELYGEYLSNAQGEDVVGGTHTPQALDTLDSKLYTQLSDIAQTLEDYYHDVQDIEFTVESGLLYILQTRKAKRTDAAALQIAIDMVESGHWTRLDAFKSIERINVAKVKSPTVDSSIHAIAQGIPASPGVAYSDTYRLHGVNENKISLEAAKGKILLAGATTPTDVPYMLNSSGILTISGGVTCHAAVVARGFNIPAVLGVPWQRLKLPESITIDGGTGKVYSGEVLPTQVNQTAVDNLEKITGWFNEYIQ